MEQNEFEPEFSFLRVVTIEYPHGSVVADLLRDEQENLSHLR